MTEEPTDRVRAKLDELAAVSKGQSLPAFAVAACLVQTGVLSSAQLLKTTDDIITKTAADVSEVQTAANALQSLLVFRSFVALLDQDRSYTPSPETSAVLERLKAANQPPEPEEDQG